MTDHARGAPFQEHINLNPLSGLRLTTISPVILEGVVRMGDVVIAIVTGLGAALIYLGYDANEITLYTTAITLSSLLFLSLAEVTGRYSVRAFGAPLRHLQA